LRTSVWAHECSLCHKNIITGEKYYDGGYGHRQHQRCVEIWPSQKLIPVE